MNKLKKINMDFFVIITINLFADSTFIIELIFLLVGIFITNEKLLTPIWIISTIAYDFLKLTLLPFGYNLLLKKSQNKIIKNFILNLKTNKYRYVVLISTFIILLISLSLQTNYLIDTYKKFSVLLIAHIIISSLFSSYLVLFAYWDFVEKRKLR